jgi:hypothetical protein
MTIEQAKRLEFIGFPHVIGRDCYDNITQKFYPMPTEKEMMEYLYPHIFQIEPYPCTNPPDVTGWRIVGYYGLDVEHADLTEALVQACEAVGGGK